MSDAIAKLKPTALSVDKIRHEVNTLDPTIDSIEDIILTALVAGGTVPEKVEERTANYTRWAFVAEPGTSMIFKIYAHGPTQQCFLMLESALCTLIPGCRTSARKMLIDQHGTFGCPFRYVGSGESTCSVL